MDQLREVLKEVLTSVLPEAIQRELTPIHKELGHLRAEVNGLRTEFNDFRVEVNERFKKIEERLDRIETSQRDDVVHLLQLMDKNARKNNELFDGKINALNKRLLNVEAAVF